MAREAKPIKAVEDVRIRAAGEKAVMVDDLDKIFRLLLLNPILDLDKKERRAYRDRMKAIKEKNK